MQKLANNIWGQTCLYPKNPGLKPEMRKITFFHKVHSILSGMLALYINIDPGGLKTDSKKTNAYWLKIS